MQLSSDILILIQWVCLVANQVVLEYSSGGDIHYSIFEHILSFRKFLLCLSLLSSPCSFYLSKITFPFRLIQSKFEDLSTQRPQRQLSDSLELCLLVIHSTTLFMCQTYLKNVKT